MRNFLLCISLLFTIHSVGQDFTHLSVDVAFDTTANLVLGKVSHRIAQVKARDTLALDAIKMEFKEVLWNGTEVKYSSNDTALFVIPGSVNDTNNLYIRYRAQPQKGLYFVGFEDESYRSPRQIWTQGQGIDHRHWIPHNDDQTDKVIVDLTATFHKDFNVVSNGMLKSVENKGDLKTWHYAMQKPMSSYLIALMIARYDSVQTNSKSGIALTQYFYPERADDYPVYYKHNEKIFNFLQSEIEVPYPWQNYKQAPVQDFRHGAMENTTATLFGDFFLVDEIAFNDRNYTYINAHELAHQWFGNLVTARGSKHHWLHEGFATYYQWLSEENLYGSAFFDWERKKAADQVFMASLNDTLPLAHPKAGSARFYQKGAWVLHMLQQKIGRQTFRQGVKNYLNNYQYDIVTTNSLQQVMEEACACPLERFFNEWVHTPGEPFVHLKHTEKDEALYVELRTDLPFAMPLQFVIYYENGQADTIHYSFSNNNSHSLKLSHRLKEVRYWSLANADEILAHFHTIKPLEMWRQQYKKSKDLLIRYRAVEAMSSFTGKEKEDFLKEVVANHKEHYGPRAKALELLIEAGIRNPEQWLILALNSYDVQLQKKAVLLIEEPKGQLLQSLAQLRKQGQSYELRDAAIQRSIDFKNPDKNKWLYDDLWEKQPGIPGHKVHITTLVYRILIFKDKAAFDEISDYASPAFDFMTRMNAIEVLGAMGMADEQTIDYLFRALFHSNWKLRGSAKGALQRLNESPNASLIEKYIIRHSPTWSDFQNKLVQRTFET